MHGVKVLGYVDTPVRSSELGPMVGAFLEPVTVRKTEVSNSINLKSLTQFALKKAILDNEFKAFFQPKFNLVAGAVDSLEALARWDNSSYGLLFPGDVLPLLNSFYLLDDLFFSADEPRV